MAGPADDGPEGPDSAAPAAQVARRRGRASRWLVRGLVLLVVLPVAWDIGLRFLAPPLARNALVDALVDVTGRPAALERVEIDPWALVVRLRGLELGGQHDGRFGEARSHARLALLEVDLSWRSLRRLAPVIERLRIDEPAFFVARSAGGTYDGADLLTAFGSKADPDPASDAPDAPPVRFSIANITVAGGSLVVDDRKLDLRHTVDDVGLRVPFVSSLPVDQAIEVVPGFEAVLDGAPITAEGRMLPFAPEPTGEIELAIESFDLTRWLAYLPGPLPVKLEAGAFASRVTVRFAAPANRPARVAIDGRAALGGIELRQPDGRELASLPAIEALDIAFDSDASRLSIGRIVATQPAIAIERRADEEAFLEPVVKALGSDAAESDTAESKPAESKPAATEPSPAGAFEWSIGQIVVEDGRLRFDDQAFSPKPLGLQFGKIAIEMNGLGQSSGATIRLSALADGGERLSAEGTLGLAPLAVSGRASIDAIPVERWAWLAPDGLALTPGQGRLAVSAGFAYADDGRWSVSDGGLTLRDLRLADRRREVVRVASFDMSGIGVDPAGRRVEIGQVRLDGARVVLQRLAGGGVDAERWWQPTARQAAAKPVAAAKAPAPGPARGRAGDAADTAWQGEIGKLSVSGVEVELAHPAGQRSAPLKLSAIAVDAGPLPFDGRAEVPIDVSARIDRDGRLAARGTVRPDTGALALAVQMRSLPVPAAQPWLPADFNASLVSGALSADGRLQLGFEKGKPAGGWQGSITLDTLNARLKREAVAAIPARRLRAGADPADLLSWRKVRLDTTRVTFEPLFVDLGDVAIDGLRSRLVIQPDGRFNLQALFDDDAGDSPTEDGGASAGRAPVGPAGRPVASGNAAAPGNEAASGSLATGREAIAPRADDGPPMDGPAVVGTRADPPPKTDPPPVRIGRVTMTDGNIDFSDYFIQPNYSANLTGLAGEVGEMGGGRPADLKLDGRVDNTGAVSIEGRIDPIGEPLFLDLKAKARDIDLPALSPYSGKYVGYGIEKGKLAVDVAYRLENGQLTADNRIVLDQLTFGEPVDSPDALQLPVLFAVSLLKDRNGVIDVDLPISGSLDDPQFSIAGIVMRIIGNLIVKAVTAPFSLIAGLVGGSAEELSAIQFAPAGAELDDAAKERLGALAKGLTERPALQLEIGGRWLETDRGALQQAQLDARLRRIRRAIDGSDPRQPIAEAQRPALLTQAWLMGRVPPPPEKERPPPDAMQRELVEAVALPADLLLELANRRAQAAKDWLVAEGAIEPARLFVVAPKAGDAEAGVELTLK